MAVRFCKRKPMVRWTAVTLILSVAAVGRLPAVYASVIKEPSIGMSDAKFIPRASSVKARRMDNRSSLELTHVVGLRGGSRDGTRSRTIKQRQASALTYIDKGKAPKVTFWSTLAVSLSWLAWENREALAGAFNKKKLQDSVLRVLEHIQDHGRVRGLCIYAAGMAVWELLGMSTIPVETAAGMAFGYKSAFLTSAGGKMAGALCAFWMGRLLLSDWVKIRLQNNTVMQLVDESVEGHPLRTALLLKFSCLPEFVKNFGTSVLIPVKPWMFFLSTAVHGWPYSALWTYLGNDAVARMQNESMPPDRFLQVLLIVAGIIGIIGSPTLMAWWVRDLKMQSNSKNKKRTKR